MSLESDAAPMAAYLENFRLRHNEFRSSCRFTGDAPTPWASLDKKTREEWRDRVAYTKRLYASR